MKPAQASRCAPHPAARLRWASKTALISLPLIAVALLLLWPAASRAEASYPGASGKASASLNFRIIIPSVMRVLENSHPAQLQPSADGSALTAEQRLVVVSNMRHGFCVALRQASPERAAGWRVGWQLQASGASSPGEAGAIPGASEAAQLSPQADGGYRLCTTRPGRYTLLLQHAFPTSAVAAVGSPVNWPIQTELTAL